MSDKRAMDYVNCLLQACAQDDFDRAVSILDSGCNVDCADEDETTPLQTASAHGNEKLVQLFLSRGAVAGRPNNCGCTPLMHAARNGHTSILNILIQNNAKVNAQNKLGMTALTMAVRSGNLSAVRLLLDAGCDVNGGGGMECSCEINPLAAAAQNGLDSIVKVLLDRGADVNWKTLSSNLTPLMYASLNGHKSTVQSLVEHGADVDWTNAGGKTALDIAAIRRMWGVKGYLERRTKPRTNERTGSVKTDSVIEATKNGDFERVETLVAESPSRKDERQSDDGATPIMFAAILGRVDIVKFLVQAGAEVDVKDYVNGWTALMQAVAHGKNDVAKYLIEAGADVNATANNGCTAFDLACLVDDADTDLIRLLTSKTTFNKVGWKTQKITQHGLHQQNNYKSSEANFKAWWSRLSNRFRNLRLNRTLRLSPIVVPHKFPSIGTVDSVSWKPSKGENIKSVLRKRNVRLLPVTTNDLRTINPEDSVTENEKNLPQLPCNSISLALPPAFPAVITFDPSPSTATFLATTNPKSGMPPGRRAFSAEPGRVMAALMAQQKKWSTSLPPPRSPSITTHSSDPLSEFQAVDNRRVKSAGQRTCDRQRNATGSSSHSSKSSRSSSTITPSLSEIGLESGMEPVLMQTCIPANSLTGQVRCVLKSLSLLHYQSLFEEQEVDFEAFLTLNDQDLQELGIEDMDSRLRLMNVIREIVQV